MKAWTREREAGMLVPTDRVEMRKAERLPCPPQSTRSVGISVLRAGLVLVLRCRCSAQLTAAQLTDTANPVAHAAWSAVSCFKDKGRGTWGWSDLAYGPDHTRTSRYPRGSNRQAQMGRVDDLKPKRQIAYGMRPSISWGRGPLTLLKKCSGIKQTRKD